MQNLTYNLQSCACQIKLFEQVFKTADDVMQLHWQCTAHVTSNTSGSLRRNFIVNCLVFTPILLKEVLLAEVKEN